MRECMILNIETNNILLPLVFSITPIVIILELSTEFVYDICYRKKVFKHLYALILVVLLQYFLAYS